MSSPNEPYIERTVVEQPAVIRHEVVTRNGGSAGWWIAALVAIVAIIGIALVYNSQPGPADLQAARDSGRAQAVLDTSAVQAQSAAANASQAATNAASSVASATQSAADSASAAADRVATNTQNAAANAQDAATDATAPAQPNP
jgi:hypothetical protein